MKWTLIKNNRGDDVDFDIPKKLKIGHKNYKVKLVDDIRPELFELYPELMEADMNDLAGCVNTFAQIIWLKKTSKTMNIESQKETFVHEWVHAYLDAFYPELNSEDNTDKFSNMIMHFITTLK